MKKREALCIAIFFLLAIAAGYRIGADSVPALQITIDRRPPAPIIVVSPAEYAGAIVRNGDLEQNTFTSTVASCTVLRPKSQDMKMQQVTVERIK